MSKIREAAQNEECTMRLYGICNHNPETTVLAHIRGSGNAGKGMKPPDVSGVFACSACHDAIDGRVRHDFPAWDVLQAMLRTHDRLRKKGLVQ
jgi:hypothetical protein